MELLIALLALFVAVDATDKCSTISWTLSKNVKFQLGACDDSQPIISSLAVPTEVHLDLINAKVLYHDPYFRFEEQNMSWVAKQCWYYETEVFALVEDLSPSSCALKLSFAEIDAPAEIYLNNQLLGNVINAHRSHTFDVDPTILSPSNANKLRIVFPPALEYAKQQSEAYPYVVPATENYNVWAEPTQRSFLRKPGSDFGWDWGPAFVQTGIYGAITFYQVGLAKLHEVVVRQEVAADLSSAQIFVRAQVELGLNHDNKNNNNNMDLISRTLSFAVFLDDKLEKLVSIAISSAMINTATVTQTTQTLDICILTLTQLDDSLKLWWPRGLGEQHLYSLKVELLDPSPGAALYKSHSHSPDYYKSQSQVVTKQIGLRRVQMIQDSIASKQDGHAAETMYVAVNNIPVYLRGANSIPLDSFRPRVDNNHDYSYLIQAAIASNMNTLRVWGGGNYVDESFYNLADTHGILLWQEAMFACALYPSDKAFLTEVELELKQQLSRLLSHPSICVLGGNNENEIALNWFTSSVNNRDLYVADYSKLYGNTIYVSLLNTLYGGNAVVSADSELGGGHVAWVDSSPSNGLLSSPQPYAKVWGKNPSSNYLGDVHFYDYSCDCEQSSSFPAAKLVTEFGFQSHESYLGYQPVTASEDRVKDSSFMQFRQRHEDGDEQMETQVSTHYSLPVAACPSSSSSSSSSDEDRSWDSYLYLSTIQQGRCYATAITTWRSLHGVNTASTSSAAKNNMGALFWQMQGIWQGPSWAAIEYGGRWRPMLYEASRAFDPLLFFASLDTKTNSVSVTVVNDLPINNGNTLQGSVVIDSVVITAIPYDAGSNPVIIKTAVQASQSVAWGSAKVLLTQSLTLSSPCSDMTLCYLKATATATFTDGSTMPLSYITPLTVLKTAQLVNDVMITIYDLKQIDDMTVGFVVSTSTAAPHLLLEITDDNDAARAKRGVYGDGKAGWFTNNNFFAESRVSYSLTYTAHAAPMTVDDFTRRLRARSLQHTMNCELSMKPTIITQQKSSI